MSTETETNGAPPTQWPAWVQQIRDAFIAAGASVFLIHGVRDRFPYAGSYLTLPAYLQHVFCADKLTVFYDIGDGMRFGKPEDENQFKAFLSVARAAGLKASDEDLIKPAIVIPLLQEFLFGRDNVALVVDYVDKIAPRDELRFMTFEERRIVAMLRGWADDPRLSRRNSFVFLLAESLADVSDELYVRSARTEVIEIPMPSLEERTAFVQDELGRQADAHAALEMTPQVLAEITNGLSRTQIGSLLRSASRQGRKVSFDLAAEWKRRAIEAEIGELVEFTMPRFGLDALAGVERQKEILLRTADALRTGKTAVVPKGILLTGPPGCGKTFCMECFAHDCGLPFVQLKNIFSKYVGSTESNLEKLFHYLEALSPVFVFIDEFDQSYGRRVTSDGDSGVSRRVFGMFNNFLSDERHQGRVLFGAATNRPDLIDPSTMRAGRFDLKLPFLLPDGPAREAILKVSLRSLDVIHEIADFSEPVKRTEGYSGADLKEIIRVAHRRAVFAGREKVTDEDLQFAVSDYIGPSTARGDEIRLMELLAVLSCTSRALLPEGYLKGLEDGSLRDELESLRLAVPD
jgi:transitional endoplasmic reticulum ATPase